jgi:hypothetical protein
MHFSVQNLVNLTVTSYELIILKLMERDPVFVLKREANLRTSKRTKVFSKIVVVGYFRKQLIMCFFVSSPILKELICSLKEQFNLYIYIYTHTHTLYKIFMFYFRCTGNEIMSFYSKASEN